MVGGFNTNIRHRGRVFHVQTEDSGEEHPHIVTLLYEGGAILTSKKHTYSDSLGTGDVVPTVRELMERQHRAMVASLKAGELDPLITGPDADGETQPGLDATRVEDAGPRRFGAGVITPRPLDEIILSHLSGPAPS